MKSKHLNLLVGMMAVFERASASLNARDESTYCPPDEYIADNDLQFSTYCSLNLLAPELGNQPGSSITECMDMCSNYHPACMGVTHYFQNQTCSFKGFDVNTTSLSITDTDNVHSALTNKTEMLAIKADCPYENNTNAMISGFSFQILCDQDMRDYGDFLPWGQTYGNHASTMGECMQLCLDVHPLCVGVSWNPDKKAGWSNCYLKNSQDGVPVVANTRPVSHSGLLVSLPPVDTCSGPGQIVNNNQTFNTTCLEGRVGSSNFTSFYSPKLKNCVGQCATNDSCVGVLYDNSFHEGIKNCYFLNATGSASTPQNFTYAELVSSDTSASGASPSTSAGATPTQSSDGSSDSSGSSGSSGNSGSSSSKAWIAGPVIGAIAAVAIVVAGWFWWRRRGGGGGGGGRTIAQEPEKQFKAVEVASHSPPQPQSHPQELPNHYQISEAEGSVITPRHELES
ncbi:uncharacterized protein TRUGW13939_05226 [Talaromyces rugulosus]|uniref:Apple domain-containing protein n=1 Tax=Talaromyces rugulosus TaxID=121627 RepID=A0A7H8QX91_TALRU|nr:uncharacterized protein TRUGW13939_05226 [Talaromyces rugulosus]QKX58105.1 hypothetical protein TRUGW13939_05226 [Talaromyces rugulosus]